MRIGPEGNYMTEQIYKGTIDSMTRSALTYIKNTVIMEKIFKIDVQYMLYIIRKQYTFLSRLWRWKWQFKTVK